MYEPHRPYPFAALLVLCLALCADSALAGATGGWEDGAPPAVPDRGYQWHIKCFARPEHACAAVLNVHPPDTEYRGFTLNGLNADCLFYRQAQGGPFRITVSSCKKPEKGFDPDPSKPEPPESGGGGDFGGGGASDTWEEDPKKPDEDKKDPEEPKDPDPDFGDLGDIPKPPVPPASEPPGVKPPSGGGGVAINIPEPCTGAAAGTVGCMKPGTPSGEVPKTRNVDAGKDVGTRPVSNIKGCPDPRTFDFWGERYELSYDMLCEKAPIVKSFVMFSSSLSGFLMMLSVFRRK